MSVGNLASLMHQARYEARRTGRYYSLAVLVGNVELEFS